MEFTDIITPNKSALLNIVIIDDEPHFLMLMKKELEKADLPYEITLTQDYKSAIGRAIAGEIDIVISDYSMPDFDKNGIEILKDFKACSPKPNLGLVLLTAKVIKEAEKQNVKMLGGKIWKKGIGYEGIVDYLKLYIEQNFQISEKGNSEYKTRETMETPDKVEPIKRILLVAAKPYLTELEQLSKTNASIHIGPSKKIKPKDLINEINNFTPLGMCFLEAWYDAFNDYKSN